MGWPDLFAGRIVVVSGKGGTGKSTVAAALAWAAASAGRQTLLTEVEGRGEIAGAFGIPDPGFRETPVRPGLTVLSITPYPAALEYLHLYVGLDRVTRPLLRSGVLEQLIGAAPGFRDLLITGKLYELTGVRVSDPRDRGRPLYDLVVVDAPPLGQLASFLEAPGTFAELIRVGRMRRQAAAIERMLRRQTAVLLVSTLEEMAVAETLEALPVLARAGVDVAAVAANRRVEAPWPRRRRADGIAPDPASVARWVTEAGLPLTGQDAAALLADANLDGGRRAAQDRYLKHLRRSAPVLALPEIHHVLPRERVEALAAVMAGAATPAVPGGDGPAARRPPAAGATRRAGGSPPRRGGLGAHVGDARIVVVCGSGGVGKTTISAAVALRLAEGGRRTALLTVDPARRLATALRLPTSLGDRTEVPVGRGQSLEAMQLDTQRTFDELVRRHAGSVERRERILGNAFYRRIADTLAGTHEYMAMEKLYQLAEEEDHDAIVIDTPPTRSALSFLDAPRRLTDFLGGRLVRFMLWPGARAGRLTLGLTRIGAAAFARTAGRLVGAGTLADAVEFLAAFEGMFGGFRERAGRVRALMASPTCAFLVVAAPETSSLEEAGFFVTRLRESGMRPAAAVVNRWREGPPPAHQAPAAAPALAALERGTAEQRAAAGVIRGAMGRSPRRSAEYEAVAAFVAGHPDVPVQAVPELTGDVHDLAGLRRVANELFDDPRPTP